MMKLVYIAVLTPLFIASAAQAQDDTGQAFPEGSVFPAPMDWSNYQPPASGPTLEQSDPYAQPYVPSTEYQENPAGDLPTYEDMNPNTDPVAYPYAVPTLPID